MFSSYKAVLCAIFLMFSCPAAQENRSNEVNPAIGDPGSATSKGFGVNEQVTTQSLPSPAVVYCQPHEICTIFKFDITGSYVSFDKTPCGNCTKGYGCTVDVLERQRCRLLFKCERQPEWKLSLTAEERKRAGITYTIPAQNVILQDENGQSVNELRHCPRYEFMSDSNVTDRNVTAQRPIANVPMIHVPYDDSTTEILEPLE